MFLFLSICHNGETTEDVEIVIVELISYSYRASRSKLNVSCKKYIIREPYLQLLVLLLKSGRNSPDYAIEDADKLKNFFSIYLSIMWVVCHRYTIQLKEQEYFCTKS